MMAGNDEDVTPFADLAHGDSGIHLGNMALSPNVFRPLSRGRRRR